MPCRAAQLLAGVEIPQLQCVVARGRQGPVPVRQQRDRIDAILMAFDVAPRVWSAARLISTSQFTVGTGADIYLGASVWIPTRRISSRVNFVSPRRRRVQISAISSFVAIVPKRTSQIRDVLSADAVTT